MNRIIFSLFISAIFFVGCKNKVDDKLEKEIIRTLEENNKMLNMAAKKTESDFYKKLAEPETKEKAEIWFSKVQLADSLLKELNKNLQNSNSNQVQIVSLYNHYCNELMNLDLRAKEELTDTAYCAIDSAFNNLVGIGKEYSTNLNLIIHLYKNKAAIKRNIFSNWCLNQIHTCGWHYETFNPLVSTNSHHFKPNEKLEIVAGIGYYSTKAHPQVYINDKEISLSPEGVAKYLINVGNKIGTFKKLVKILFTKPDGTLGTSTKEIIYTVD